MTSTADAVVIGAGHNGLVAANLLVDAGWDVTVLEATEAPGGAVRSAYVTAPGYLSDLYSSFYPLGYASPVLDGLGLERHGLSWTHAPDVLAHLLPDGRAAVVNRDLDTTAASLEAFAPGDGERWRHAYADWRQVAEPMLQTITTPFPPVRGGLGLLRQLRVGGALRLARRLLLPVRKLGAELFQGEGGTVLLAGCALHTDLSPEEAGSGVYGWLLAMLGQQVGWPVPVGGAQRITDALVARLVERGGRIEYGARVERVLTARGRAMGVRTAGGTAWRARRAVLADVPAPALFLDLVGAAALPPRMVEDLALQVGRLHAQGRLGAVRAGAVEEPGTGRRRHRAPGRGPRRAHHVRGRTGPRRTAPGPVPAGRADVGGRPEPLAAGHRVALVLHAPAVPPGLAGRGRRGARGADGGRCWRRRRRASGPRSSGGTWPPRPTWRPAEPSLVGGALGGGTAAAYQQVVPAADPRPGPRRHPRWTGSTWPAPPPTPAAVCTARRGRTRRGPRWPATGPSPARCTPARSPPPTAPSTADR
ncbi:phytoene dehydrogenase [Micromonospora sp. M42]|nr:phytoene dehydrogenase [Micromonospora sp. M42]